MDTNIFPLTHIRDNTSFLDFSLVSGCLQSRSGILKELRKEETKGMDITWKMLSTCTLLCSVAESSIFDFFSHLIFFFLEKAVAIWPSDLLKICCVNQGKSEWVDLSLNVAFELRFAQCRETSSSALSPG